MAAPEDTSYRATVRQVTFRADKLSTLFRRLADWLDTDPTVDVVEDVSIQEDEDGWSARVYYNEMQNA